MRLVLIILAVFICVMLVSVGLGWISMPFQKVSTENVQQQWAFAYQYDESLRAVARQVCSAEKAMNASTTPEEAIQRRSQVMAYEQNYARVQAEYDAKLRNAFEAKYIRPNDVPPRAPDLSVAKLMVCR